MRKTAGAEVDLPAPSRYGPDRAELTFLCWGSTYGPLREAVDRLNDERPGRANMLHFSALHPFPLQATEEALRRAGRLIVVEGNATGQLETLLRARTGRSVDGAIRKVDGRPFSPEFILSRLPQEAHDA